MQRIIDKYLNHLSGLPLLYKERAGVRWVIFGKTWFFLIAVSLLLFSPYLQLRAAGPLQISPTIIDEKVKTKEILKQQVKIKNTTGNKLSVFVFVSDLSEENGIKQVTPSSILDNKKSVASWTSIQRGFDLVAGEEKEISLEINVSPFAEPGKYYGLVSFAVGSNATDAGSQINNGASEIIINLEVQDNIVEKMQALEFKPARNLFVKYPVELSLSLKNTGNTELIPVGNVYIYDRSGREVDNVKVKDIKIAGGEKKEVKLFWNGKGGLGKFKGRLELEYGQKDRRDVQDMVYFWVFPTKVLIIFGGGLFFVTFLLTYLLFRKSYRGRAYSGGEEEVEVIEEKGILDLRK